MSHEVSNMQPPANDLAADPAGGPDTGQETGHAADHETGQHHPISLYLKVWGYLFILSALSYAVDYFQVQGMMRWTLIVVFMLLKAGLIMSVFMHMVWERLSLVYAVLVPPLVLLAFVRIMVFEADYASWTRLIFLGGEG